MLGATPGRQTGKRIAPAAENLTSEVSSVMKEAHKGMTRRTFVANAVVLPALAGLLLAETKIAEAKGSQSQFKYQGTPKDGHKCSQCTFYIAGSSAKANGTCKIVDGSISPNGWCTAWAAKSS